MQVAFEYKAANQAGEIINGTTDATSKIEAYRHIAAMGLTPISLRVASKRKRKRGRVAKKDIAHLTHQLAVFIEAGIPIAEGLASVAREEPDENMQALVIDVAARIESGEPIAEALAAQEGVFDDMYIENIRAAERSGTLGKSLQHLSELLEKSEEAAAQLKAAMAYPVVVVAILSIAALFLMAVVLPKFATMYAERGIDLPMVSSIVMGVGVTLNTYWYLFLGTAVAGVFMLRRANRSPKWRLVIDRTLHKIPAIKRVLIAVAISRFVRVLGLGLGAGLNLIECLELAGRASGRPMLSRDMTIVARRVEAGERLADALASSAYLTPFARRMLRAGEDAGQLPKMTDVVARHYDRESKNLIAALTSMIEPILVVMIAGVVLVVALAVFLPMWNMVSLIG